MSSPAIPPPGFFAAGGTLRHDAPSYVERRADRDLLAGLLEGQFCYVLTSRQMGKSSLMVRTATRLREQGVRVVVLDLTAIGLNVTPEQWYGGLLLRMAGQLDLEPELEAIWAAQARLSPVQRFFHALREALVLTAPSPLVVFVDEIDVVRSLPFSTDEFFAAIRECYNRRPEMEEFRRVSFSLLGVAAPSDLIRDTRMTPFNIGRRIELNDFTPEEAAPLAKGLAGAGSAIDPRRASRLLLRVLHWTHGHPYLTQRLCQRLAEQPGAADEPAVDVACEELFLSPRARDRDDNLVFVRERMLRNEADRASLLHLYEQVMSRRGLTDGPSQPLVEALQLAGIVRSDGRRWRVRNRIYARVFDQGWVGAHMPDAELRRQREAFRRGVLRASGIAAGVLLVLSALTVLAMVSRQQAREASWTAFLQQARVSRASALAGQQFDSLDILRQAARIRSTPDLRDEVIASIVQPDLRKAPARLALEPGATALVFSDDLSRHAFGTASGEVVVRGTADNAVVGRWRAGAQAPGRLQFSRDGQHLAVALPEGERTVLSVWTIATGTQQFAITNQLRREAFDLHPDGRQLAYGTEEGLLQIRGLPGGEIRGEAETARACATVRFDPAGGQVAVGHADSLTIGLHEAGTGRLIRTLHSPSPVAHLAWHPDGQWLAGAGEDERVRLWDLAADEFARAEMPQGGAVLGLAFSHSGRLLATAASDRMMRLWDAACGRLLLTAPEAGRVGPLQFSRDDQRLGHTLSGDTVQFWEVAPDRARVTLAEPGRGELRGLDVHPDGRLLAVARAHGVTFWDLATGRRLGAMPVGPVSAVRFDAGADELVTAEFRGAYRFRLDRGEEPGARAKRIALKDDFYLGPGAGALDVAVDTDLLAVAYADRIRLVKNTNSAYGYAGELLGEPGFQTVAVSPDGHQVAAGNWNGGEVWTWDLARPLEPRRLAVQGRARVRFSPDGRWLATGTERRVTLWDAAGGRAHRIVERAIEASRPAPVAFARVGGAWAFASGDSTVRLMDAGGRVLAEFESPGREVVVDLVFSPDGSRLVAGLAEGAVAIWDLAAVSAGLAEFGFAGLISGEAGPVAAPGSEPPFTLTVAEADRLRWSPMRSQIGLRREIEELTNKIRQEPDAWHLYRYRAEKWQKLGGYREAAQDYQRWIELDRAAVPPRPSKDQAWPLRDLARLHLFGPPEVRDPAKAFELTATAIRLDEANPDNQYRHGVACLRLARIQEAQRHFELARQRYEADRKEQNVATVLFYEALCQAHQRQMQAAAQLLEQAKAVYARSDLKAREGRIEDWSELIWETERVIAQAGSGG